MGTGAGLGPAAKHRRPKLRGQRSRANSMKRRSYLATGITVIGALIGWSLAQTLTTPHWDEQKARDIALTIANGWKFSPDQFQTGGTTNLQHQVYAVLPFDIPGTPRQ